MDDKTIITGTDKSFQRYLHWWTSNVRKHFPGVNITICDFGMDKKYAEWSKENCNEYIKYENKYDISWFL